MTRFSHFCHDCKLKFLKAKDYILHHNYHHIEDNNDRIRTKESQL